MSFRATGHRVVDLLADHLDHPTTPVLPPLSPSQASASFDGEFREEGRGPEEFLDGLVGDVERVIGAATKLHHPGFVGHQVATPLPLAALMDLVDSFLNNGMAVFEMGKAGVGIEKSVLHWLTTVVGFPVATTGGALVDGGSIGNLTALLAARQAKSNDAWKRGVRAQPLCVFVADTAHYSVARAVRVMGLGDEGCVSVAVDDRLKMDVSALRAAIEKSIKQKKRPIAVVASAGSTAAGAYDDLDAVADVCAEFGLWCHVDGAHGAPLALLPERRAQLKGLERADSIVADFHKMLLMPALVTGVLFRDAKAGAKAFDQDAGYLFGDVDDDAWSDVGRRTIECTKKMLGLKVWACLRAYGVAYFRDHVRACCEKALALAALISADERLELLVQPEANIVCFRVRGKDGGQHAAIRKAVIDDGDFYCVQVHLHARGLKKEQQGLWLRTTLLNPATTTAHLQQLLSRVLTLSETLNETSAR